MTQKKVAETPNTTTDYLKGARDLAFVIAVFLYYMGWIYIYFYLDKFGLSMKAVDIDLYTFFIYCSNVFIYLYTKHWWKIFFGVWVLLVLFYIPQTAGMLKKFIPLFIVALFPAIFFLSKIVAESNAYATLKNPEVYLNSVRFVFKEAKPVMVVKGKSTKRAEFASGDSIERRNLLMSNDLLLLRLVASNKEEYFVLQTSVDSLTEKDFESYIPVVYSIKKESIEFIKISH